MLRNAYKLRYLPLFYEDLEEKIVYIAEVLQNQQVAKLAKIEHFLFGDSLFNLGMGEPNCL